MKKPDFNKLLTRSVILVLCAFFVIGVAWGAESILDMEGTAEPYTSKEALSTYPETDKQLIAYTNHVIEKALAEKPKLDSSFKCKIESDSITNDGPELLKSVADYISGAVSGDSKGLEKAIENSNEELSANFGEGFDGKIKTLTLNIDDVASIECDYDYYICPVCGEDYNEAPEKCDECDCIEPMLLRHRDEYTITIKLKDNSLSVRSVFDLRSEDDCMAITEDKLNGFCTVDSLELNRINPTVVIIVNRLTDELKRIEFTKDTEVSAALLFNGEYEYIGTANIGFSAYERQRYDFTWPGLSLSAHTLSMEKKATEVLKATLSCEDPLKETVRWSISDESLASIDEEGYIKAGKTDGKFTATAEFDYQGKTYTDSCEVYIKTSVESVDLSDRSLTLKPGETHTLITKVSPKKATIQTVTWYSENEAVATVDANGTVTAVGEGKVNVYALTDDGWYKATCNVEVTK